MKIYTSVRYSLGLWGSSSWILSATRKILPIIPIWYETSLSLWIPTHHCWDFCICRCLYWSNKTRVYQGLCVHASPLLLLLLSPLYESRSTLQIHSCAFYSMYLFKARCVVLCVVAYFTALGSLGNYEHCNRSMTLVIFPF